MFGKNNIPYATIQNINVENFDMSSGTWLGSGWAGGARFNTISNPSANDPAITHTLMFDTPVSNVVGNNLIDDLTVDIWDSSGIQVQVDNVRVTNYPRDRTMLTIANNGTFETPVIPSPGTGTNVVSGWNNNSVGMLFRDTPIAPLSNQTVFFNSSSWEIVQTFPGMKLLTNRTYQLTFDSYSVGSLQTIKAGLVHARYFGESSRGICPIDDSNVVYHNGDGTWLGSGWESGALFTNILSPSANDPAISHIFLFNTPHTLSGDKLAFDLGVKFWDASGTQVRLDNVVVTNYVAIPEPGYIFIIYYFGLWIIYSRRPLGLGSASVAPRAP